MSQPVANTRTAPAQPQRRRLRDRFWFHLLLIIGICVLSYLLFFASLAWVTRHGDDAKVPDVQGKDVKQAIATLENMGFEVVVDSAYDPKVKAFKVLNQSPDPNDMVKNGRTIFLTISKAVPPNTPMPNLIGFSLRSASLVLQSNRLVLGDTIYRPDISMDAVLVQSYNGQPIKAGQMIPQGSRIDLVIGSGLGESELNVPDVAGLSYAEAIVKLQTAGLTWLVTAGLDQITDTSSAIVYMQTPNAINDLGVPSRVRAGEMIDLQIKQFADMDEIDSIKNAWKYMVQPDEPIDENAGYRPQPAPTRQPATPAAGGATQPKKPAGSTSPKPATSGSPKPGSGSGNPRIGPPKP